MITPLIPDPSPTQDRASSENAGDTTADDARAVARAQVASCVFQYAHLVRHVDFEIAIARIAENLRIAWQQLAVTLIPALTRVMEGLIGWMEANPFPYPKSRRYTHSARHDVPRLKRGKHTYQLYVRR